MKWDSSKVRKTLAVDLDLTLTRENWKSERRIGPPAPHSARVLRRFIKKGWQVIIFTCRPHSYTVRRWAERHLPGLISAINCNPDDIRQFGIVTPKPYADIYIDEKAWPLCGAPIDWLEVERDMEKRGIL
jgi:hypothetical protein